MKGRKNPDVMAVTGEVHWERIMERMFFDKRIIEFKLNPKSGELSSH